MKALGLAALLTLASVGIAQASTVDWANSVVQFLPGGGTRTPDGELAANALLAPDTKFVSLGDGGLLALAFPGGSKSGATIVVERTNGCANPSGGVCPDWPEQVEVFVGSSWNTGGTDTASALALNTGFTSVGLVTNGGTTEVAGSSRRSTIVVGQFFTQIVLVDRTALLPGHKASNFDSNAGFDVDAVGATPVPGPAALPLIATGVALFGLMRRRRRA